MQSAPLLERHQITPAKVLSVQQILAASSNALTIRRVSDGVDLDESDCEGEDENESDNKQEGRKRSIKKR